MTYIKHNIYNNEIVDTIFSTLMFNYNYDVYECNDINTVHIIDDNNIIIKLYFNDAESNVYEIIIYVQSFNDKYKITIYNNKNVYEYLHASCTKNIDAFQNIFDMIFDEYVTHYTHYYDSYADDYDIIVIDNDD